MTNEEIIRMAREARLSKVVKAHSDGTMTIELPHPEKLKAFARLVAAAEREACAGLCEVQVEMNRTGAAVKYLRGEK